jgi:hypothetical protein
MAVTINGDGTISGVSVGGLPDGVVDSGTLATGIDATKLADGTITNSELQYINSLSSNAQTQINGAGVDGINSSANADAIVISSDEEVTMPLQPAFYHNTAVTGDNENVTGDGTYPGIDFLTQRFDIGGNTDSTGIFTAPITGIYLFIAHLEVVAGGNDHDGSQFTIDTGGVDPYSDHNYIAAYSQAFNHSREHISAILQMTAGWTAEVKYTRRNGSKTVDMRGGSCHFCGILLS